MNIYENKTPDKKIKMSTYFINQQIIVLQKYYKKPNS